MRLNAGMHVKVANMSYFMLPPRHQATKQSILHADDAAQLKVNKYFP